MMTSSLTKKHSQKNSFSHYDRSFDKENAGNDSGVEMLNCENTPPRSLSYQNLSKNTVIPVTVNQNKPISNTKSKRRGSLWNLFKTSKSNNKSWNLPKEYEIISDSSNKNNISSETNSVKIVPIKLEILPNSFGVTDSLSKTSDLGDSVPSTPVSTISSTGLVEIPGIVGMDNFIDDISQLNSKKNKISKNNNQGGLTHMLAMMIKSLWQPDLYNIDICKEFHEVIGMYGKQYGGFEQQDAQEFFMWLIDKIHEESIQAPKKKQKEFKKKKNQMEEEQAVVAFACYTKYYQSYIQGLFLSQYHSMITCLTCLKRSTTFDSYTCLSLSLPQEEKRSTFITILRIGYEPLKVAFFMDKTTLISELKDALSKKFNLNKFMFVELLNNGVERLLKSNSPIGILSKQESSIYAMEVSNEYFGNVNTANQTSEADDQLLLVVSNVEIVGAEHTRFGHPLLLNVSKTLSFKQIQILIRKNMSTTVKEMLNQMIKEKQMKLGLHIIPSEKDFLNNSLEYPLINETISRAIIFDKETKLHHLYLVAEWEPIPSGWYMHEIGITRPLEDPSCNEVRLMLSRRKVVDLEACLKLQTQEEKLAIDDVWKCPSCHKDQQGVTKKLTLWSLPDVLVIHLKRFDQLQEMNGKISTLVEFPVKGLNMSPHVATSSNTLSDKLYRKQSLRLNYQPPPRTKAECLYDLKAVCNHIGSRLNSGHYTASCYNSANGNWYSFDDKYVHCIGEDDIVTPGAYLLFYQRRVLSQRVPENINLSISKCLSAPSDHWSYTFSSPFRNSANSSHYVKTEDPVQY